MIHAAQLGIDLEQYIASIPLRHAKNILVSASMQYQTQITLKVVMIDMIDRSANLRH